MPYCFLITRASAAMLLAVVATPAASQPVSETAPVIVVTANRSAQPLERIGQSVTVIDASEIEQRQTQTVADVLRSVPGVSIGRNGGIGTTTAVFIRGAESDQTVTLIDGVKLNDPSSPGGGFDFGNLLIGNIERIEVLRGPSSLLWGSQAIGGVVNMITRQPTSNVTANLRGEYGFRQTAQIVGNIAGTAGPLSASAGGGWFRTDGISAFNEARGGAERDGYENFGANANLRLTIGEALSIDARGWYSDGRANIDGFAPPDFVFGDVNEQSRTRELVGYAGINATLLDGRFRNRLGFAYTDTRRRNTSFEGAAFETFSGNGRNERFEYQAIFEIAAGWQANAGIERETSRYSAISFGGPVATARAQIDSAYGQIVATPFDGLTLTGGVRHDDHNRFGGASTFAASGVLSPSGSGTTLRASYAEGFKAPSLFQLQSDFGNQQLRPERSRGWDAGITQRLISDALHASVTVFRRLSTDQIIFVSCPQPPSAICVNRPFGTYDNVARTRAQGIELGLTLQPVETLRLQANYTYTNATNQSPTSADFGKQLIRRPQHSLTSLIDYRWWFGLETGATITHVGGSFETTDNAQAVQGYVLADLRASLPIGDRVEVTARVENLFDAAYETVLSYGTPGRAGYVGVRVRY